MAQLVTLVYGVADPDRDELVLVNAGHPPGVVLRKDGTAEQLPTADGPPLGVSEVTREQTVIGFCAGDTLVAFTDGLIERREEDIDDGQHRALVAITGLADQPVDAALEQLVEDVRDHTREDDVAVLVARRTR
jgi:serine phosphatase RsbU (regulator of sigma subunit)